ncbi:MAG TPA: hypothetical protein DCY07_09040 [Rhodospirillaceae bacterium]|nr:hypothetical protein [Rhodospirillaceae bacterium]
MTTMKALLTEKEARAIIKKQGAHVHSIFRQTAKVTTRGTPVTLTIQYGNGNTTHLTVQTSKKMSRSISPSFPYISQAKLSAALRALKHGK